MSDYDSFDLQSQLDSQDGYSQDNTDSSGMGIDYLQGQYDMGSGYGGFDLGSQLQDQAGFQQTPYVDNSQSGLNYLSSPQNVQGGQGFGMGGVGGVLSQLFNNKGVMSGLGALLEGSQNKKSASNIQNLVAQQQQQQNPFGGQRNFYQQQLQNTVQNPYSQPIVQQQVQALQQAQAIKDAAAGRRSNSATSSPALAAAQAQIAQQYMNSLMQPAGAGISPSGMGGLQQLLTANQQNTNGYISPLMSALGYNSQANRTQQSNSPQLIEALQKFLSGGE